LLASLLFTTIQKNILKIDVMKKKITLLPVVLCLAATSLYAQTTATAPQVSTSIALQNAIHSSEHAHNVSCTKPLGAFSATRTVCPCGAPYTIPFVLTSGVTVWLPAPQWVREAGR
jgi:hypothetical protein